MDFLKLFGFEKKIAEIDSSDELAHINQEMYKKSVELNERNKTLSLLQKIDEIILSDITHLNEIAQKVTSLLVTDIEFQLVALFLCDKKADVLKRIAFSEAVLEAKAQELPYFLEIPIANIENTIVQAISERSVKFSQTIEDVLLPKDSTIASPNIKTVLAYPLIVRGEVIGSMVVCLKESQEELSQFRKDLLSRLVDIIGIALDSAILYNEVQESNEKLKTLDKLKDEFVSVASHELRTPMTAIKSYLWMALQGKGGPLNEKQTYYIDRGYRSVDRLMKLVNDMLNISRIESGRITIQLQSIDLQTLTQEVVDEVTPRAQELGVIVTVTKGVSLPPVLADPDKIKEVLFNLIGNSLKFTPKEGNVTISFSRNDEMVEVSIKDTGSGIDPDDIPKLFQKFALLPDSYTTNQAASSGTGLGLYICRSIIELHKGKVWVKSEGHGKGSEFGFSLKVFNEADLQESKSDANAEKKEEVGIIHTRI